MKKACSALLIGALLCAACGSTSSGADAGGGGGGMFVAKDAHARRDTAAGDQLFVQIASLPDVCGLYKTASPATSRDYDIITFELRLASGTLAPGPKTIVKHQGAGTYTATQGTALYAGTRGCQPKYGGYARGTLNITALDDMHVAGTYDLAFDDGWPFGSNFKGELKGSFDAPVCALGPGMFATVACN